MPSTSTSDRVDTIVSVEKLNLVFHTSFHRPWTLREAFTRLAQAPLATLAADRDRLQVANDISFTVKRGEIVGILGANGSGKTSLCRCIAGMYQPTAGRVAVAGEVRAVFDTSLGIQPELTGRENAVLLSHMLFSGHPRRAELVEDALAFSELGKFVDVPFKNYSNGMQARLCLSLISSSPAELLILDEVFDGADVFFREKIAVRVARVMKSSGAVLFVSHSSAQVREVCNRVIVLDKGTLVYDGDVEKGLEFYEKRGEIPAHNPS